MTTNPAYHVIGTRPLRPDGIDKVTGRAVYGADVKLPGMLHGKILRSPHAHARIVSIDTTAAEALPGVRAVVTAHDLPDIADKLADLGESVVNLRYSSSNILAHDKVLYYGHAVAAVAADNVHIAEEAVNGSKSSMKCCLMCWIPAPPWNRTSPILLEDLRTDELGKQGTAPTNVARHILHERGDLDQAFAKAAVSWNATFTRQPSTRATSSPTAPQRSGTKRIFYRSGAAPRAPLPSRSRLPRSSGCRFHTSP